MKLEATSLKASLNAQPDRREQAVELARMLTAFPARQGEADASIKLRTEAYYGAVSRTPLWALRAVVNDVISGRVADIDQRFAPTPPQLANIVRRKMLPVRERLDALSGVLGQVDKRSEPKQSIIDGFAELKRELGGKPKCDAPANALGWLRNKAEEMGKDPSVVDAMPDARRDPFTRPAA